MEGEFNKHDRFFRNVLARKSFAACFVYNIGVLNYLDTHETGDYIPKEIDDDLLLFLEIYNEYRFRKTDTHVQELVRMFIDDFFALGKTPSKSKEASFYRAIKEWMIRKGSKAETDEKYEESFLDYHFGDILDLELDEQYEKLALGQRIRSCLREINFNGNDVLVYPFSEEKRKLAISDHISLLPYQENHAAGMLESLESNSYIMDSSPPGTGKMYVAQYIAEMMGFTNVVIISQLIVLKAWESRLKTSDVIGQTYDGEVLAETYAGPRVIFSNPGKLTSEKGPKYGTTSQGEFIPWIEKYKVKKRKSGEKYIVEDLFLKLGDIPNNTLFIFDEVQIFKGKKKVAQFFEALMDEIKTLPQRIKCLFTSATFFERGPDFYYMTRLFDPTITKAELKDPEVRKEFFNFAQENGLDFNMPIFKIEGYDDVVVNLALKVDVDPVIFNENDIRQMAQAMNMMNEYIRDLIKMQQMGKGGLGEQQILLTIVENIKCIIQFSHWLGNHEDNHSTIFMYSRIISCQKMAWKIEGFLRFKNGDITKEELEKYQEMYPNDNKLKLCARITADSVQDPEDYKYVLYATKQMFTEFVDDFDLERKDTKRKEVKNSCVDDIIEKFQKNEKKIFISTTMTAGTGIGLHDTEGGHPRVMYVTPGLSASLLWQTMRRTYRQNMKSPTTRYLCFVDDFEYKDENGDDIVIESLEKKMKSNVMKKLLQIHAYHLKKENAQEYDNQDFKWAGKDDGIVQEQFTFEYN